MMKEGTMGRGRPPKGLSHVDSLPGDEASKAKLKTILATILGELTVAQARKRLGVSETRFHELRRQALEGMLSGVTPRPAGRPPAPREPEEVTELRERVAWLEEELEVSRLQTEIAMWKASLLRESVVERFKKKEGSSPSGRSPHPSGDGGSGT